MDSVIKELSPKSISYRLVIQIEGSLPIRHDRRGMPAECWAFADGAWPARTPTDAEGKSQINPNAWIWVEMVELFSIDENGLPIEKTWPIINDKK